MEIMKHLIARWKEKYLISTYIYLIPTCRSGSRGFLRHSLIDISLDFHAVTAAVTAAAVAVAVRRLAHPVGFDINVFLVWAMQFQFPTQEIS